MTEESRKLDPTHDLPTDHPARAWAPSSSAYQCPKCYGIAYNPVCPYCAEEEEADDHPQTDQ